jgi:hypothetical protein
LSATLETQVYQAVIGNAGITSLLAVDVGGNATFYAQRIPQQNFANGVIVYPAGVYQRIAATRLFYQGPGSDQANVGRGRFRFTFWANTNNAVAVLGQIELAVIAMLKTFDAYNPPGSPPTFIQAGTFAYSSQMGVEPETQPPLYKLEVDFSFWFADQP